MGNPQPRSFCRHPQPGRVHLDEGRQPWGHRPGGGGGWGPCTCPGEAGVLGEGAGAAEEPKRVTSLRRRAGGASESSGIGPC